MDSQGAAGVAPWTDTAIAPFRGPPRPQDCSQDGGEMLAFRSCGGQSDTVVHGPYPPLFIVLPSL